MDFLHFPGVICDGFCPISYVFPMFTLSSIFEAVLVVSLSFSSAFLCCLNGVTTLCLITGLWFADYCLKSPFGNLKIIPFFRSSSVCSISHLFLGHLAEQLQDFVLPLSQTFTCAPDTHAIFLTFVFFCSLTKTNYTCLLQVLSIFNYRRNVPALTALNTQKKNRNNNTGKSCSLQFSTLLITIGKFSQLCIQYQ